MNDVVDEGLRHIGVSPLQGLASIAIRIPGPPLVGLAPAPGYHIRGFQRVLRYSEQAFDHERVAPKKRGLEILDW